jgi:uncharacterized protein
MSEVRKGGWIQTYTGRKVWPLDMRPEDIDIVDIAHSLSNQCRFSGHVSHFYSVAMHSFLVSMNCDLEDRLWGLLHDAAEAYLVDLPRPLKNLPEFGIYREAEAALMKVICRKFSLPEAMPASVSKADDMLLATEANMLLYPVHPDWIKWVAKTPKCEDRYTTSSISFSWSPEEVKMLFLGRFKELHPASSN